MFAQYHSGDIVEGVHAIGYASAQKYLNKGI